MTENLDAEVLIAIREAVEEAGQPEKVSKRLIAWLSDLSLGKTDLSKKGETESRFETLRRALAANNEEDEL